MTRKETMIAVRDFWINNMGKRIDYLYDRLPNESILTICDDLLMVSKNVGIYTSDLPESMSCSTIPEMSASTPNSDVRLYLNRFLAMITNLIVMCGRPEITASKRKLKYCSDLEWNSISDIIEDIRRFRYDLFKQDGMFDSLIKKCEELDNAG